MEGTAGNFHELLADLAEQLPAASVVALDLEMTGASFGDDSLLDTVEDRYQRVRKAAEQFSISQLGLTLVHIGEDGAMGLVSYNIWLYPTAATQNFMCASGGLKFLSRNGFDFNRWIKDGVPFRARTAALTGPKAMEGEGSQKLWSMLCDAQKPVVAHSALTDLAFLCAAFEASPLPSCLSDFAVMLRRLTPCVWDTAHLHTVVGNATGQKFRRLGVAKFLEEAEQRAGNGVSFKLEGQTLDRYGPSGRGQAHEAGFDSFMTAKLFCCLKSLAPFTVDSEGNRLFLWRSVECVSLSGDEMGFPAYFSHCEAFLVTFAEGSESRATAELKDLWRHGGDKESTGSDGHVVLWPKGKDDQREIALPSAVAWAPLPWPPRKPTAVECKDDAKDEEKAAPGEAVKVSSPGVRSATKKRPAAAAAAPPMKRPATTAVKKRPSAM